MMAITHAVASVSIGVLSLQTTETYPIALLVLGSQLPDVDNTQSYIGRMIWPLARWFEERWPHRSITHSLLASLVLAIVSYPLLQFGWKYWLALSIGHFIAICTDTLTPEGVQLFWPSPVWAVCGSNPNARIRTGSKGEIVLLGLLSMLLVSGLWINNGGGFSLWINQIFAVKDSVEQVLIQNSENHIYVNIQGFFNSDKKPINQKFWVIEKIGSEFLLADKNGIYKTGENITASRLVPTPGEKSNIQTLGVDFNEEEILPKLQAIATNHPNSLIFISGNLEVDSPEEIKISINPHEFKTITLSGNSLKLESAPLFLAIKLLNYQFAKGSLKARIINPVPKL